MWQKQLPYHAGWVGCASAFQKQIVAISARKIETGNSKGTDQGQTITLAFVQLSRNLALASAKVGAGDARSVGRSFKFIISI
jgi:hypothetical protein